MSSSQNVSSSQFPEQTIMSTGLRCKCPRCGEGKLYQSMLKPVDNCSVCGLDMSFAENGDGPAVLVILLLGGVITGLALILQYAIDPPIWVHILVWTPVTILLSIASLKVMKSIMIAAQYKTKAAEGVLVE